MRPRLTRIALLLGVCVYLGCSAPVEPEPLCGNGLLDEGELCDDGNRASGDGCEADCTDSCQEGPDPACDDQDPCNGVEVCGADHRCRSTSPPPDGAPCGQGGICLASSCAAPRCGDGFLTDGEQCEPPGSEVCDGDCQLTGAEGCGDGIRQAAEQCDDANRTGMDGCSATCRFEQAHRVRQLRLVFSGTASCPANALGQAIVDSTARQRTQEALDRDLASGALSLLLLAEDLDDLEGRNAPSLRIGYLTGAPMQGNDYDGGDDLDWWYKADPSSLAADRAPGQRLPATLESGILSLTGLALRARLGFLGISLEAHLVDGRLSAATGPSSKPLVSSGESPGHLPSEALDPALQSFASVGEGGGGAPAGLLCGSITAESLGAAGLPAGFPCAEAYTAKNSLLDLVVGGCTVLLESSVRSTQPDGNDPLAPKAGQGGPYRFIVGSGRKVVGCRDSTGAQVDLATCLRSATYSTAFRLATGRVIIR